MKARRTHDLVATIGTYEDRQTGEKKKRYQNVGSAFTGEDGRMSLKLDAVPVGPEWSGWISLYEIKDDRRESGSRVDSGPAERYGDSDSDSDIAF